ncbi:unnamed protein product [Calypogeia fissa]
MSCFLLLGVGSRGEGLGLATSSRVNRSWSGMEAQGSERGGGGGGEGERWALARDGEGTGSGFLGSGRGSTARRNKACLARVEKVILSCSPCPARAGERKHILLAAGEL